MYSSLTVTLEIFLNVTVYTENPLRWILRVLTLYDAEHFHYENVKITE